ncbi:MAG TPA: DUF3060 domain-containing protein [Mycobacterium sp.]|jgi:hypothetical protein
MAANEDPEDRIRELERPLADEARASEMGNARPAGQGYPPYPAAPAGPPPPPWTYGGVPYSGPPQRPSGNRMWWILGSVIVIGVVALAAGIAAFAAHQISGVKSIIASPPTVSRSVGPPPSIPFAPGPSAAQANPPSPSTSPVSPPGTPLSVAGINENRTIACNDNIVSVSGVSNTVVISGHCTSLSVSGVKNAITVEAVDSIEASGFDNKVTYHSGTPKIDNSGDSNVVQQG